MQDCLLSLPSMPSWSETLARLTVALKVHLAMSGELLGFPQLGRGSATDLWWTKVMYCLPCPPGERATNSPNTPRRLRNKPVLKNIEAEAEGEKINHKPKNALGI